MLSPAVDNLVAQLTRLPGIGTRTAQRLAFHLLAAPTDEANALGLVDVVSDADTLLETAVAEATTLARIPRTTYAMTKIQLHRATLERIAARQPHDDTEVTERWQSAETIAGMADFLASLAGR